MLKLILAMFVLVIVLVLVTSSRIVISALALSSGVAGPVIQEAVNTGNPELDKQVNKFYGCISKITHEPQELVNQKLITAIFRYLEVVSTTVVGSHRLQMNLCRA
jgi:hypothetical protein